MVRNEKQITQYEITRNGIAPCPIRETCAAYNLPDAINSEGVKFARGCMGNIGWCNQAKKAVNEWAGQKK